MYTIQEIIDYIESWVPLEYQEGYDNCGIIVGTSQSLVHGILITVDITEAVLTEAIKRNCNFIIAHHPLIFRPLKKLIEGNHVTCCIKQAIKNDLTIYALHTNLDNLHMGVNHALAQQIGIKKTKVLKPKANVLQKLTAVVTKTVAEQIMHILTKQTDNHILGLEAFTMQSTAQGNQTTNQQILTITGPKHLITRSIHLISTHQPSFANNLVYNVVPCSNVTPLIGAGIIGELPEPLQIMAFLQLLKDQFHVPMVKYAACKEKLIQKVAVCGGAGIFLLPDALEQNADALVTADIKYHDFFESQNRLLLVDIGHYESELCTKNLIYDKLSEKFSNIVVLKCQENTNPVHYF